MANALINAKTIAGRKIQPLIVKQAIDPTLYTSVSNGSVLLPPFTQVTLVTSGGVATTKQTLDAESTWANAKSVGSSAASSAAIAALTPVSQADATDLASAQALANANKAKINAIIAALKA